jgi:DnaB-like helicase C terminal domain
MSVESFLISQLVSEGSVRKAYQAGITAEDFDLCDEEFKWLERQAEQRLTITVRRFKRKFPDFELIQSGERTQDLIEDLKKERAYISYRSALDEGERDVDFDNVVEKAVVLREILGEVVRDHSPASDALIKSDWRQHLDEQKRYSVLRELGETVGIPTQIQNLDHHWGGLQPGNLYLILGRPGDAKSFFQAKLAVSAVLDGRRVGFFSPEMNERAHRCRFATLFSAEEKIQQACGLKNAFRNRALMDGHGYNLKTYKRFLEYVETMPGEICLFTQKYRRQKMTASYIESRIEELGLEIIFIDPIYKLRAPTRRQLKHEEIADLVDSIQELAQGYNIPAVISNQANRASIGTKGEPPSKESSFGSDAPVQEADTVIGVRHFSDERLMRLRCSKNRYGDPFNFDMAFHPNVGKMVDVTPIKGDYWNGFDPEKAEELRSEIRKAEREVEESAGRE